MVRIHLSIFIAFNVQFAFLNEITQKLYINQQHLSNVQRGTYHCLPRATASIDISLAM